MRYAAGSVNRGSPRIRLGLGAVAQAVHLPLLTKRRDLFEVTAVCDLSAEVAELVSTRFGLDRASRQQRAGELLGGGRVAR